MENSLFFTIPLGIAVGATVAVVVLILRKSSYLRRLTPESHELGDTVLHDFAPEVMDWYRHLPWKRLHQHLLGWVEVVLARLRGISFTLGKASDSVIRNVRRAGQQAGREHEQAVARREAELEEKRLQEEHDLDEIDMDDPEQLKAEEQRLIVAVAQDPKDHGVYSDLARVYMRLHAFSDAVDALEQAHRLAPGDEQYLKRLERAKRKRDEAKTAQAKS